MATANPNLGAVRGYAGGGFISKLFGPSETVTEKFARQDAEFRAKHPDRAQAAPQQQAPTGIGGIKGMVSGSLKTNLQEREKAAGLKAGGMVKKCVTGGKITGPGGPTDDLVPIMASNGEFMIKASSAKVLGPKVLKALNDVGGKGVESKPGKMADGGMVQDEVTSTGLKDSTVAALNSYTPLAMPQLKTGGMVRKMVVPHMAEAGSVDEARRRAEQLAKIPTGGRTAPAPDGLSNGNDFTRNVNTNLNALGGMGVAASVPLKAAQAGQGAIRTAMNAAPVLQNGIPRLAAPIAKAAQAAPDFVAGASGVQRVGGANLPAVIADAGIPIAKSTNVALQTGAQANQMAAGTRSLGNASAGAGMLDGQQAPLQPTAQAQPSAPSLNAPWYSPEYAKAANMSDLNGLELERARRAAGSPGDANDPLKSLILNGTVGASSPATAQAKPATAATPAQSTLPTNARGQGYNDPRQVGMTQPNAAPVDEFSNAAIAQRNPGGMVRKVVGADGRTTYSGSNISGEVSFQGAGGNALPGRPGGGFMVTQGGGQTPGSLISGQSAAVSSALAAAAARGDMDAVRGFYQRDGGTFNGRTAQQDAPISTGVTGFNGQGSQWEREKDAWNNKVDYGSLMKGSPRRVQALLLAQQKMAQDREMGYAGLDVTREGNYLQSNTSQRGQDIQDKRNSEANQIAQGNLGLSRDEFVSKMAKEKQVTDLQNAYMNAKTPEEKDTYRQKMIALGLIKTNAPTYHAGSKVTDAAGNQTVTVGTVFNPDTGEVRFVGNDKAPSLPQGMTKQVGTSGGKPVYEDANGKRFQ